MYTNVLTMKCGQWCVWMKNLISCLAKQGSLCLCVQEMIRNLIPSMSDKAPVVFLCLPNLLPDGVTSARVNTAQQRIGQKKSNI